MSELIGWSARPVLEVADLGRSVATWCDLLGFVVVVERPDSLVLRAGAAEVALERAAVPQPGRAWFAVRGVEALHERCLAAGPATGPLHTHESGRRDFELTDPDGNRIRFAEPPTSGARVAGLSLAIDHPERSLTFWSAVVGFENAGDALRADGRTVATVRFAHGVPPMWWTHFAVESMEEALAEVESRGGRVVIRGDALSVVADPNGALAALVPG